MTVLILQWLLVIVLAFFIGKLVAKCKLPAILGWLIAGMIFGPHAFAILPNTLLEASWYGAIIHVLECGVGLMIGTELVWRRMKQYGKALIITTLTQSLGTFIVVSAVFGIIFAFMDIPIYLAIVFGGIALATAPAPALSIVREFQTSGPVTKTLIPMAALDDMVGVVVFFTTIAIVGRNISGGASNPVILRTPAGKPYFAELPLCYSVSHSADFVILAASDRPIGADIEQIRPLNLGVAKRFFAPREQSYVFGRAPKPSDFDLPKSEQSAELLSRFYEIWTKKEAFFKQRGTGIVRPAELDTSPLSFYTESDGEYALAVYEE